MKFRNCGFMVICLFLWVNPVPAQEFSDPCVQASWKQYLKALNTKDYQEAIRWLNIGKGCPLASKEDQKSMDAKITECKNFLRQKQERQQTSIYRPTEAIPEIEMVYVEGGTFQMGSNDGDNDEKPVHTVTLDGFYIGKYEVTQKQWRAVMGSNPSYFSGCDNCPVENVSWADVQEFILKLNQMTGKQYRLPTEAQWEFAARAGNKSKGYMYSGSNEIGEVSWYDSNSGSKTHPVGQKKANELGIFDMSGNVWEWCSDWHNGDYYANSPRNNPENKTPGSDRVGRGGSWLFIPGYCRVADRYLWYPGSRYSLLGFRLLRME